MLDQTKMPIIETLQNLTQKSHAPFYAPGHKHGKAIPQPLTELLGMEVFPADLPELPELDNLFAPDGVIQEAQELAAETFGALHTRFLVNGSTTGIIAGILATCGNGEKIILPRNIHQSVISGLIISGAIPIFINPEYDFHWDIPLSITAESIGQTLAKHPDTKAVMIVNPTYHGVCGNIRAIAQQVHKYNIPLLVDEAHGAHFAFHSELPIPALVSGADLSVQSTHKTLGAMTQASMLHIGSDRIDLYRLQQALQILQSSSPSYLLLASLDAARQQMALFGEELMSQTLELAKNARNRISQLWNYSVFDLKGREKKKQEINFICLSEYSDFLDNEVKKEIRESGKIFPTPNTQLLTPNFPIENSSNSGFIALDKTRLTIKVSNIGFSGYEADKILHQELGVTCELPSFLNLTFIISPGNTLADINQLVTGLISLRNRGSINLAANHGTKLDFKVTNFSIPVSPRDAFFCPEGLCAHCKICRIYQCRITLSLSTRYSSINTW
jgi:Arginine/lysine/ornithine decarboxylases